MIDPFGICARAMRNLRDAPSAAVSVCSVTGPISLVTGIILILAGCVPLRHTIVPYESDPAQAQAVEAQASERCVTARSDKALPPYSFKTDGCSMWPDGDWVACCVEHDIAYWCGGSTHARAAADQGLNDCLVRLGHPTMAEWVYIGVRIGGHPWLPFPWRWGYGWDWPYRYDSRAAPD